MQKRRQHLDIRRIVREIRDVEFEDQKRHGDGEDAIAESLDPVLAHVKRAAFVFRMVFHVAPSTNEHT